MDKTTKCDQCNKTATMMYRSDNQNKFLCDDCYKSYLSTLKGLGWRVK